MGVSLVAINFKHYSLTSGSGTSFNGFLLGSNPLAGGQAATHPSMPNFNVVTLLNENCNASNVGSSCMATLFERHGQSQSGEDILTGAYLMTFPDEYL